MQQRKWGWIHIL